MSHPLAGRSGIFQTGFLAAAAIFSLIFMEWLFYFTKPSFLSNYALGQAVVILLLPAGLLALTVLVAFAILALISKLIDNALVTRSIYIFTSIFAAIAIAVTALILLDNFTNTVAQFGIQTAEKLSWRLAYLVLFVIFSVICYRRVTAWSNATPLHGRSKSFIYPVAILAILVVALFTHRLATFQDHGLGSYSTDKASRPNVVIISGDGLDANRLSAYGSERATTTFIKSWSKRSLLFENAFSNSSKSGASLTSMMTSKLPSETRLIFPPDILTSENAYNHLPGILRTLGYRNIEVSERLNADAFDLNLLESYDVVNDRPDPSMGADPSSLGNRARKVLPGELYFLDQVGEELASRAQRLLTAKGQVERFDAIKAIRESAKREMKTDYDRMASVKKFIGQSNEPFFAHIHLMGTHGPRFYPGKQVYSKGQKQTDDWMNDFYDDSILEFDGIFKDFIEHLRSTGKLDNTVIVLHTDHGSRWSSTNRLPLIIRFPGDSPSGRVTQNVEMLDVAPTILDYMGVDIPKWMRGRSLISDSLDPLHPVMSAVAAGGETGFDGAHLLPKAHFPPFYGLGGMTLIVCQKQFVFDFQKNSIEANTMNDHTAPCPVEDLPDKKRAGAIIASHLSEVGYDTKSLSGANSGSTVNNADQPGTGVDAFRDAKVIYGLYSQEHDFRWMSSDAEFQIRTGKRGRLVLTGAVPDLKYLRPMTLTLFDGTKNISSKTFGAGFFRLEADLPKNASMRLRISADKSMIPAEKGLNKDPRELSVQLSGVSVE